MQMDVRLRSFHGWFMLDSINAFPNACYLQWVIWADICLSICDVCISPHSNSVEKWKYIELIWPSSSGMLLVWHLQSFSQNVFANFKDLQCSNSGTDYFCMDNGGILWNYSSKLSTGNICPVKVHDNVRNISDGPRRLYNATISSIILPHVPITTKTCRRW